MNFGIIICTRKDSRRIPEKPFRPIAGKPIIRHLVDRLAPSGLPIVLATPGRERDAYTKLIAASDGIHYWHSQDASPLHRTADVAAWHGFDAIIRVTHDKVLVDPGVIADACKRFQAYHCDYLYSSYLPDGAGFEIISNRVLQKAAERFDGKAVEHISYAIRAVNDGKTLNYRPEQKYRGHAGMRFLIDYPSDLVFFSALMGNNPDMKLDEAIAKCLAEPWLTELNRLPLITVYTCAYNAQDTINRTIASVFSQGSSSIEYIIVNDASTDNTFKHMLYSAYADRIKIIHNPQNIGLAASSNLALENARGRYIIRLDADDFFMRPDALAILYRKIVSEGLDVVYPAYVDEKTGVIRPGKEMHHAGCALFDTKALRHLKFNEELRNLEGFDLWARAQSELVKIGYAEVPVFFYSYSPNSMSNTNLAEREKTRREILQLVKGDNAT